MDKIEKIDKGLEEAAEEFAEGEWDGVAVDTDGNPLYAQDEIEYTFKAGAEWQKSQMLKDAVEGKVNQDGILELSNGEAIDICPSLDKCALGLQPGDKVRIIIMKRRR